MKNYKAHRNHAKPSHFLNSHGVFCVQFCVTHMGKMRLNLNLLLWFDEGFQIGSHIGTLGVQMLLLLGEILEFIGG